MVSSKRRYCDYKSDSNFATHVHELGSNFPAYCKRSSIRDISFRNPLAYIVIWKRTGDQVSSFPERKSYHPQGTSLCPAHWSRSVWQGNESHLSERQPVIIQSTIISILKFILNLISISYYFSIQKLTIKQKIKKNFATVCFAMKPFLQKYCGSK